MEFEFDPHTPLTEKEREEIACAAKMPIIFDEDSPEMTPRMKQAFIEARERNPWPRLTGTR